MKRAPMVIKMKQRIRNNPEINDVDMQMPRTNGLPMPKLKDILESEVEDRYYLRNDVIEKLVRESEFEEKLVSFKVDKK